MRKELLAKQISEIIQKTIPEDVKVTQIAVYGQVTAVSYMIYYYVKQAGTQDWDQCYKIYRKYSLLEKTLEKAFSQIAQLLREETCEEWTNFTLIEKNSEEVLELLFDNTDLSDGSYEHMKEWEKTYLV